MIRAGAAFFWLLAAALFFARRYRSAAWLPLAMLAAALAFDGHIIGFQVFTIQRFCILCFSVAAALGLITVLISLGRRRGLLLLAGILVWTGAFAAASILEMPEPTGAFSRMVIARQPAREHPKTAPTLTLVFSMQCPHCRRVVKHLAAQPLSTVNWRLAVVDQDQESLARLAWFVDHAKEENNLFAALNKAEELEQPPKDTGGREKFFRRRAAKALTFLGNLGERGIPLLVIEDRVNHREIITGDAEVLRAIAEQRQAAQGKTQPANAQERATLNTPSS